MFLHFKYTVGPLFSTGHEQVELALVLHQWGNDFFAMPDILDGLVVPYGSSRTFLGSVTGVWFGDGSKPYPPVVHIKIAGKWMFIPLKMVCIGIDP